MGKWDRKYLWAALVVVLILVFAGGMEYSKWQAPAPVPQNIISAEEAGKSPAADQRRTEDIQVYVAGAVENAGVFKLSGNARVYEALDQAAPTSTADLQRLNLAARLEDGQAIIVPEIGDESGPASIGTGIGAASLSQGSGKVNINSASVQELDQKLPGIGPAIAQRIVDYRSLHGSFARIEDLKEVSGIGDKKYADLADLIMVR